MGAPAPCILSKHPPTPLDLTTPPSSSRSRCGERNKIGGCPSTPNKSLKDSGGGQLNYKAMYVT